MENVGKLRYAADQNRREVERVTHDYQQDQAKLRTAEEEIPKLTREIAELEKKIVEDRQKLSKDRSLIPTLKSKIEQDQRILRDMQNKVNMMAKQQSDLLKASGVQGIRKPF